MKYAWPTCLFAALICAPCRADELTLDTIAGTGAADNNGETGPALSINVGEPFGVEIGPDGALYVTEVRNHRIRRVDLKTGQLATVAGCGRRGYSGDGGRAVEAEINEPYEVRFDRAGNIYFVEMQNHVVRRVDRETELISTVAGTGQPGFGGDGGPATAAALRQPHSIALDDRGALYIADIGNHRIRRVDLETGLIESIAGTGEHAMPQDGQIARGSPILGPRALCIDGDNLWIALREGHSVWRLDLSGGALHHVAGTGAAGFSGDGGPASQATFNGPKGIAVVGQRALIVVDTENHALRAIDLSTNEIATIAGAGPDHPGSAGDGATAVRAQLNRPHGVCVGPGGVLYIGDTLNHRVRRVQ